MKKGLLLLAVTVISMSVQSQTIDWYYTTDGVDPGWTWEYKDVYIPVNMKLDSIYGGFQRPGHPASAHDWIFTFTQGPIFDVTTYVGAWTYGSVDTSLYSYWIDLTSFNFTGEGMVRVALPVNGGAIWDSLGVATSSIAGIEEIISPSKELIKVVDLMGRETQPVENTTLIYIFSDGTIERIFIAKVN